MKHKDLKTYLMRDFRWVLLSCCWREQSHRHAACQTKGVPKHESSSVSSFSLLFACWSVEADQSAQLSAMHRPPIIPPWWEADCRKGRTLEWLCQGSSRLLTVVWVEGSRGAFHQKPHMEAISVAVRTGTFPSPPPHSLDSFFGMYHHRSIWKLI